MSVFLHIKGPFIGLVFTEIQNMYEYSEISVLSHALRNKIIPRMSTILKKCCTCWTKCANMRLRKFRVFFHLNDVNVFNIANLLQNNHQFYQFDTILPQ